MLFYVTLKYRKPAFFLYSTNMRSKDKDHSPGSTPNRRTVRTVDSESLIANSYLSMSLIDSMDRNHSSDASLNKILTSYSNDSTVYKDVLVDADKSDNHSDDHHGVPSDNFESIVIL